MSVLKYGHGGLAEVTTDQEQAIVDATIGAVPWSTCKVILFTNPLTPPVKDVVLADLTVPLFTGYATSAAVTWGASYKLPSGEIVATGDKKQFLCSGGTPSDTITGAALVDTGGTTVIQVDLFDTPVEIAAVGQGLDYVPTFSLGDAIDFTA